MLSPNPVPGPVSGGTAGTDLGGTLQGSSGAPTSGEVQLHPLASPLHDSILVGHRAGACDGSGRCRLPGVAQGLRSAVFVAGEACSNF